MSSNRPKSLSRRPHSDGSKPVIHALDSELNRKIEKITSTRGSKTTVSQNTNDEPRPRRKDFLENLEEKYGVFGQFLGAIIVGSYGLFLVAIFFVVLFGWIWLMTKLAFP